MVTTVRVSEATRQRIRGLSRGRSADEVINEALDQLDRRQFWDQYAAAARADEGTAEDHAERQAWDSILEEGLD